MLKKEQRVLLVCLIQLVGLVAALLFYFVWGPGSASQSLWDSSRPFLFEPGDYQGDFYNSFRPFYEGRGAYSDRMAVYFPFTYFPFYLLRWMKPAWFCFGYLASFTGILTFFIWKRLKFFNPLPGFVCSVVLVVTAYPIWFCWDRGNLDGWLLLYLLGFIYFLQIERFRVSAFFLACAAAMKLHPVILGVLFLVRKQYRSFFELAAWCFLLTVISAAIFPQGLIVSFDVLARNLKTYLEIYALDLPGMRFNVSYWGWIRILWTNWIGTPETPQLLLGMKIYHWISSAFFLGICAWVYWREKKFWKQICLLFLGIESLPVVANDYKLILLFVPMVLFFEKKDAEPWDWVYAVLFGLLMVPKTYFWLSQNVGLGSVINPILTFVMLVLLILDRQLLDQPQPQALNQ